MLKKLRDYFAKRPIYFVILRKIIEFNFLKQKKLIRDLFGDASKKKVLDIGCGTGEYSNLFAPRSYVGIDISDEYISYAKKTNKREFLVMDAKSLKFDDESFDIVLIAAILHHLNNIDANKVLKEAKRILKKDGKILILEDAKIAKLDNAIVSFVQKFDIGANIRTPSQYQRIFSKYFKTIKEWEFLNGACIYYCSLMER